jgi:hypothetical protein
MDRAEACSVRTLSPDLPPSKLLGCSPQEKTRTRGWVLPQRLQEIECGASAAMTVPLQAARSIMLLAGG